MNKFRNSFAEFNGWVVDKTNHKAKWTRDANLQVPNTNGGKQTEPTGLGPDMKS